MKELIAFTAIGIVFFIGAIVFIICYCPDGDEDEDEKRDETKYRHWHDD
ncbi:hypothetical protein [Flavobacterium sp.]